MSAPLPSATLTPPLPREMRPVRSGWPRHEEDEIEGVTAVLRSGRVNALVHGDRCRAFEEAFAAYIGMPRGIALANGTLALELALRALGIGPGDEVILPPRSFFASASCILAVGATPVFVDVDPHSGNIDPDTIAPAITPRTRAVLCVHLAGWPCDMDPILDLCRRHDLKLIEDCAQSHGALYHGARAGSFGDAAAFSFCTDKIMSTGGEGGMLLLRDESAWRRAWAYKDHGKNPAKVMGGPVAGNAFRWLHDSFGTNWRMTEMQAAIGLAQLAKLDTWLEQRRANVAALTAGLQGLPLLRLPEVPADVSPAWYKFYAYLHPLFLPGDHVRDEIVSDLQAMGIPCGSGSCSEIYREEAFHATGLRPRRHLLVARELGRTSLMFPVDHTLDADDMRQIAAALRKVLTARMHRRQVA